MSMGLVGMGSPLLISLYLFGTLNDLNFNPSNAVDVEEWCPLHIIYMMVP